MKWKGRRASTNVDDARGRRAVGGGAGIGGILNLVLRIFGLKGLLVLGVVGLIGWQMGLLNPAALMGGSQVQEVEYEASAEEEELLQFVKVVLADTEDIWTNEFGRVGQQYQEPGLVVFRDRYPTACGTGDARMGPFYCPADKKIYIDLGFYGDLERQFDAGLRNRSRSRPPRAEPAGYIRQGKCNARSPRLQRIFSTAGIAGGLPRRRVGESKSAIPGSWRH